MHQVVGLLTVADVQGDAHAGRVSVSARLEAVLENGSRVLLLDGRGWTEEMRGPGAGEIDDLWAVTSVDQIAETARSVVGPDEAYGDRTQDDMAAGHWNMLAETLRGYSVYIDPSELSRLPNDVVLSDRLLERLGRV